MPPLSCLHLNPYIFRLFLGLGELTENPYSLLLGFSALNLEVESYALMV